MLRFFIMLKTIYSAVEWIRSFDTVSENCYDNNRYRATVLRWLDGDTIKLSVDLGQGVFIVGKYRLARIDAPEIKRYKGVTLAEKKRGLKLKEQLEDLIPEGSKIEISTYRKGKYGRYTIDIWLEKEAGAEYNLSNWLISEGLVDYIEY